MSNEGAPAVPAAGTRLWSSPEWLACALEWLDARLCAAGVQRTGAVEQQHLRPWATALRVPTSRGVVWFKAAAPGTAFEVGIYPLLFRAAPRWVLEPLAIDVQRGWIVLPDGGPTVRSSIPAAEVLAVLAEVLPQYAELQLELAPHADELVTLGVKDMRAALLPQRFDEALHEAEHGARKRESAADLELCRRLRQHRPQFESLCRRLAGAPGPASLDHNDLHSGNIFLQPSEVPGRRVSARFYDWGDSVVAHAFSSLLVPLSLIREQYQLGADDPWLARLRDAYLDPFSSLGPRAELIAALELACHAGKVARALTWARALQCLHGEDANQHFARAPLRWLGFLLDESYLGSGG